MKYINTVTFLFLVLFVSCQHNDGNKSIITRPDKNEMADINKYLVQKDRERIINYIDRKNLHMTETAEGLWYQIMVEGSGDKFVNNSRVLFNYECSLLDGTVCYSSDRLGPKEVVIGKSQTEEGLNEGLKLLRPGAQAIFIIPPYMAHGLAGDRKMIPPRSVIVYKVNILQHK